MLFTNTSGRDTPVSATSVPRTLDDKSDALKYCLADQTPRCRCRLDRRPGSWPLACGSARHPGAAGLRVSATWESTRPVWPGAAGGTGLCECRLEQTEQEKLEALFLQQALCGVSAQEFVQASFLKNVYLLRAGEGEREASTRENMDWSLRMPPIRDRT